MFGIIGRVRRWWRDRGRNIFTYWDGYTWVRSDPIEVGKRLEMVCPHFQRLLDTIDKRSNDIPPGPVRRDLVKQQENAIDELAMVSIKVFNLAPLGQTEGGLTRGERVAVIGRYFSFMEGLAQQSELFPTWLEGVLASPLASVLEPCAASGGDGSASTSPTPGTGSS